jgi:hypothetical protein
MADYDVTLAPVKRASIDAGRKMKFWTTADGTIGAVVKTQAGATLEAGGDANPTAIKVPSDGHLSLRFSQWPVYYSDNRGWTRVKPVPGMPATMEVALAGLTASAAELNVLDTVVAGTVTASKAVVVGADKDVDTLRVAKDGLLIGATPMTCTAAELNKLDGGSVSNAELNLLDGAASLCAFSTAAGAANTADVTITVQDAAGASINRAVMLTVWLTSDADGAVLATQHDTMAVKANGGTLLGSLTANKVLKVLSTNNGTAVISVVDAGKAAFYINAKADGPIAAFTTGTIAATDDYGA